MRNGKRGRYTLEFKQEAIWPHVELDQAGRLLAINNLRHLRTAREMAALFRDVPGAVENTVALSARLGFELGDLGYEFPRYLRLRGNLPRQSLPVCA